MALIICTSMFVCLAFSFSCLVEKRIEETMAPTALIMILILYISSLFQNLLIGKYIIIGISIVSIIFVGYIILVGHKKEKIRQLLTPGFFVFIIFFVINIIISKDRWLIETDEFSHWGRATLLMYRWNKLGNCVESALLYPGYPPAIALWSYFFVSLKRTFSESYLYAAQNILSFVLMLPIYKKINWASWKKACLFLGILLLMPLIFYGGFWSTIYVDGILGVWMIYILNTYFSEKENTWFKVLQLSLAFGIYPLVKASGSGLAFLVILILVIDFFIFNKKKNKWKLEITYLFIYVLSILAGKASWTWYLKLTNTKSAWNASRLSIGGIVSLLKGHGEEYQYELIQNFIKAFFFGRQANGIVVFDWILMIILLAIFMYILKIWSKKQLFCYSTSFILCIGIYNVFLLLLYCFNFSSYEGLRLASYERYIGSILLGIVGFIICTLVNECFGISEKVMVLVSLIVLVPISSIEMYTTKLNTTKQYIIAERLPYEHIKEFVDFMDWKKDKVYLVDQGSSGSGAHTFGSYNALPIIFSPEWGWSLGSPHFDGDVWSVDYTLKEWEDVLRNGQYTYVYVFHQDEQFVEKYGNIFEEPDAIQDKTLYQVSEEKGEITLKEYRRY